MEVKPEIVVLVIVIAAVMLFLNGRRRRPKEKRSGCLGVVACLALLPLAVIAIWWMHT